MISSNYFILGNKEFILLNDGIQPGNMDLRLRFVLGNSTLEEIEEYVSGISDILDIYDTMSREVAATFKGYVELSAITKVIDYPLDDGTYGDIVELDLARSEEVWFYVIQIKKGKMTLEDVPERLKAAVQRALKY